jgi:cytochrome P450
MSDFAFPRTRDPRVQARVAPGRLPLLGHLWQLTFRQVGFLAEQRDAARAPVWVHNGPAGWQLTLLDPAHHELLRDKSATVAHYTAVAPLLLGRSLLTRDGAEHRRTRGALNRPFTPQGLTGAGVGALLHDVVGAWAARVAAKDEVVLLSAARDVTLDVIFRILGIEDEDLPAWRHHYEEILLSVLPIRLRLPGLPAWRAARGRLWVETRLHERVKAVRADPSLTGLLADVVRDWDAAEEPGPDALLVDNLLLLALAGHETTASTCFREALRMFPPVPSVTRILSEDVEVGSLRLPAGLQVGVPIATFFRDPGLFDAPDTFRPERWLELGRRVTPLENLAFSFGPHFCLGYHVAMMEGMLAALGLAKELGARGRRPQLAGRFPRIRSAGLTQPVKGDSLIRFVGVG